VVHATEGGQELKLELLVVIEVPKYLQDFLTGSGQRQQAIGLMRVADIVAKLGVKVFQYLGVGKHSVAVVLVNWWVASRRRLAFAGPMPVTTSEKAACLLVLCCTGPSEVCIRHYCGSGGFRCEPVPGSASRHPRSALDAAGNPARTHQQG